MSCDRCECGEQVDSDFDLECYVELPNGKTICLCQSCRRRREDEAIQDNITDGLVEAEWEERTCK